MARLFSLASAAEMKRNRFLSRAQLALAKSVTGATQSSEDDLRLY
jgi:hypothetical protein